MIMNSDVSSQDSSSTLQEADISGNSQTSDVSEKINQLKSCWVEAGSLPPNYSESDDTKIGKWVLCVNENHEVSENSKANQVWELVKQKVEDGVFCYAKRTNDDFQKFSSPQLVFIYTEDCYDLKGVKRAADLIRKEVFDNFHVICYFKESTIDWGFYYQCQKLMYKYTIDGNMFKIRPKDQILVEDIMDSHNATGDQNRSQFMNLSPVSDAGSQNDYDCENVSEDDVVKFLSATVEKVEKIMTARVAACTAYVQGEYSQCSIGSLGEGFGGMALASQSQKRNLSCDEDPENSDMDACGSQVISSQDFDEVQVFDGYTEQGNVGHDILIEKSEEFEERLKRVRAAVENLQKVTLSRTTVDVKANSISNEGNNPLGTYCKNQDGAHADELEELNSPNTRLSQIKALADRLDVKQKAQQNHLLNATEKLEAFKTGRGNDSYSFEQDLKAFQERVNEKQAENDQKLLEMKERIAKMRENVREITSKHKIDMNQMSSEIRSGTSEERKFSYDFNKKRNEHKQKIAEMKQRVDEAMNRIKALNENARQMGTDKIVAHNWELVELDE